MENISNIPPYKVNNFVEMIKNEVQLAFMNSFMVY